MLERIPAGVGYSLRGLRAGYDRIVSETRDFVSLRNTIPLESSAFLDHCPIPTRYTQDGEGISPPLNWRLSRADVESLALIVEDPDAPSLKPLVHLLACLSPNSSELPEGQFRSTQRAGADDVLGKNSFLSAAWLPPDPPRGHGPHRYVFQLFALDRRAAFDGHPGRSEVVRAMKGHVRAKGILVGTYERS
jgi:Raf kinase inhibitor-like YbhB/YbcL family protein